jgi:hypothetical protein
MSAKTTGGRRCPRLGLTPSLRAELALPGPIRSHGIASLLLHTRMISLDSGRNPRIIMSA